MDQINTRFVSAFKNNELTPGLPTQYTNYSDNHYHSNRNDSQANATIVNNSNNSYLPNSNLVRMNNIYATASQQKVNQNQYRIPPENGFSNSKYLQQASMLKHSAAGSQPLQSHLEMMQQRPISMMMQQQSFLRAPSTNYNQHGSYIGSLPNQVDQGNQQTQLTSASATATSMATSQPQNNINNLYSTDYNNNRPYESMYPNNNTHDNSLSTCNNNKMLTNRLSFGQQLQFADCRQILPDDNSNSLRQQPVMCFDNASSRLYDAQNDEPPSSSYLPPNGQSFAYNLQTSPIYKKSTSQQQQQFYTPISNNNNDDDGFTATTNYRHGQRQASVYSICPVTQQQNYPLAQWQAQDYAKQQTSRCATTIANNNNNNSNNSNNSNINCSPVDCCFPTDSSTITPQSDTSTNVDFCNSSATTNSITANIFHQDHSSKSQRDKNGAIRWQQKSDCANNKTKHKQKHKNNRNEINDDRDRFNCDRDREEGMLKSYLAHLVLSSNIPFAYAIILVAFLITVITATSIITILTIVLTFTGYTAYPLTENPFNTSLALGVVCASFALALVTGSLIVWRRHCQAAYYYLDDPQSCSRGTNSPQPSETYDDSEYGSIPVGDWAKHVAKLHADGDIGFSREFEIVQQAKSPLLTSEHSQLPENKYKNRYINIVAYDHTRVTLRTLPNAKQKPGSDYINANFIDVSIECI